MFLCVHSTILVPRCILDWMNCGLLVEYGTVSTLHRFIQLSTIWLPAVYVLTGCGTTGKVDTMSAAFQTAVKCGCKLLHSFGKSEIFD